MNLVQNSAQQVASLVEKLLTIRYRKRRERFTEVIDPLFKEFQLVHKHYTSLLGKYEASLPIKRSETVNGVLWIVSEHGEQKRMSRSEERQALAEIIKAANQTVELSEPIRKTFRWKIADLLSGIKEEPERRFVYCLLAYFGTTVHGDINFNVDDVKTVSHTIDHVLSKKITADAYVEAMEETSIGASIEELLLETTGYEYPRKYVLATGKWINEAYVHVGREFQRLKIELIDKAPL